MKRKVTVVLLALVAALLLGLSVFFVACGGRLWSGGQVDTEQGGADGEQSGETEEDSKLIFALNDEGTAYSVFGMHTSTADSVTIPATYNGLPVTGIDYSAFEDCSSLKSVTIPESVTSIGSYAFRNCNSLTSVTIPEGVTSIGRFAFSGCSSLTEINYNAAAVPDLTWESGVFYNAGSNSDGITVIFGESVKSIPAFLFCVHSRGAYYSANIVNVTIGSNVESIGSYAFAYCSSLTEITISEGVTSIGSSAFYGCSNLTEITIPDSVTSIGSDSFEDCSNLTKINYNAMAVADLTNTSHVFCNAGSNSQGCTVTVGESVKSIPAYLFVDADITSVTIGGNVESIGLYAFSGCSSLTSVTIPESVTSIGSYAFHNCSNLTEINYNAMAVADLTNTSNVFYNAGSNSDGITVIFGESVKNIPAYLFYAYYHYGYYSANIVSVTIGTNVESIGSYAFYNCSGLASVTIGSNVESIGSYAFYNCSDLTEVTIPDSVTSIGLYAFEDCSNLAEVTIGSNVESIGSYAFNHCSSLMSVTIGAGGTSIGDWAFSYCSSLTSVTIPEGVVSIGSGAFDGCYKLIEVYNKSALDITAGSSGNGYVAYYAKHVYTQEGDSWFTDTAEGYRFFYDGSNGYLTGYYGTESALTLPAGFIAYDETEMAEYEIYSYAFYGRNDLMSVTIPDSVTSIGELAFYNCSGLTSVTIPESVTSIGSSAFRDCSNLTEINYNAAAVADLGRGSNVFYNAGSNSDGITVIFGESVKSIPAYLFSTNTSSHAPNLVSVTIGSNVESIGSYAFEDCSSLTEVTIGSNVESIGLYAFSGCTSLTEITIPASVTSISEDAFTGTAFYNDETNWESGVLYIGNHLISAKTTIFGAYTIKNGTLTIAGNAFNGCSGLTEIMISEGVTSIGSSAFRGCSSLTEITIPASVTSIGSYAFAYCSSLTEIKYNAAAVADLAFNSNVFYNAGSNSDGVTVIIGESVTRVPANLFVGTNITSVTIGSNVESIGSYAFNSCSSLTSVKIGAGVTSIGDRAFSYCSGLTEVTIPASVTSIGLYAFENCSGLTKVTIGAGVTSIDSSAFYRCSNLTSVTIGAGVTSIGLYAFRDCSKLTSVTFKNTKGWRLLSDPTATSGTRIASSDLANPSTAATYLKSTYFYYYWRRF